MLICVTDLRSEVVDYCPEFMVLFRLNGALCGQMFKSLLNAFLLLFIGSLVLAFGEIFSQSINLHFQVGIQVD